MIYLLWIAIATAATCFWAVLGHLVVRSLKQQRDALTSEARAINEEIATKGGYYEYVAGQADTYASPTCAEAEAKYPRRAEITIEHKQVCQRLRAWQVNRTIALFGLTFGVVALAFALLVRAAA